MSLKITSLNSGSNGNCYYVGNDREAVLIDTGLTCRETERRMARAGLSFEKVRAIFISHEHTDHTGGADVISRRYQIPVFIAPAAYRNSRLNLSDSIMIPLKANGSVAVGDLVINPFIKSHDAAEPLSFTVTGNGITVGIFTDIGAVCDLLIRNFRMCHAAFLEANYDEKMLEEGRYPIFLKNRIRGDKGHLSNRQALDLFVEHKPAFMTHLLLSHLSRDNNDPQLVLDLFNAHSNGTHISIASRDQETSVFTIGGMAGKEPTGNLIQGKLFSFPG